MKEVITMKTIVKNDRWNGIETVTVWFDDDMSTYEIIDENGDTIKMIYDGEFLDADEQVDYDKLYETIALAIECHIKETTEKAEEDLGIFEYYSVKFGYEIEIVTETGIGEFDYHSAGIFNNLKEAKELAEELIEEYDKEHTYLHTIFLATRNNKVPEDEDDEETLADEMAEIKERWTWDNELECYYTTDGYYDYLKR